MALHRLSAFLFLEHTSETPGGISFILHTHIYLDAKIALFILILLITGKPCQIARPLL